MDYLRGVSSWRGTPPDWGRDPAEFPNSSAGDNCFELPIQWQDLVYFIKNDEGDDTLYAQLNWWGCSSIDTSKFKGAVRYIPFLHEPPDWIPQKIVSAESVSPFKLFQNYPNPFNPITDIQYALPTDCQVKLVIFNVLGQKIRTLVNEHQTRGFKNVRWDGKSDGGSEVSTGIYFYKLQAGNFTETKKMLLLK